MRNVDNCCQKLCDSSGVFEDGGRGLKSYKRRLPLTKDRVIRPNRLKNRVIESHEKNIRELFDLKKKNL